MEKLEKFTTRKVANKIKKDTFFKQKCVQKLIFLIDDYGFNQIETEEFGKGSIVIFKKKEIENLAVTIEYEIGTLPTIVISLNKETKKDFSEDEHLKVYPVHYEIHQLIQGEIGSIDNYIKEIGAIWESKSGALDVIRSSIYDKEQ